MKTYVFPSQSLGSASSGDQDYGARGCYYGSVGAITEESVKKYIENQKSDIGGTE